MPNSKYDHTSTLMSGSQWVSARILAYLLEGATFDAADQTMADVKAGGAQQRNVTEIQNRSVGDGGAMQGLPAMFNVTPKGSPYQVVLAWDQNMGDQSVLAYYDEDESGGDLGLQNNGTLVVRPTDFDQATGVGTWFTL
jgi:hypothetical protein